MLFGEYAVIHGSAALAIPYNGLSGTYTYGSSDHDLSPFYKHIAGLSLDGLVWNAQKVTVDQENNLNYISDIPIGYGLGSSGALSAAVFDKYIIKKKQLSTKELRKAFQEIESYFHGSSSGIDPLVSYLREGVLVKKNDIEIFTPSSKDNSDFTFYLVDTGISRSTSPLVELYHKKYESATFRKQIDRLKKLNTLIIDSYLSQASDLIDHFKSISLLHQEHFKEMIPESMRIITAQYELKLCGAGGGGFFLGCCRNQDKARISKTLNPIFLGDS